MKTFNTVLLFLVIILLGMTCQSNQSSDQTTDGMDTQNVEQGEEALQDVETIELYEEICETPGRRVPNGEIPTSRDVAIDSYCAKLIIDRNAPNGVVTIFGSARATEDMPHYQNAYEFAKKWTEEKGDLYPILSGGGPGIMEASNKGAFDAGGVSLGFASYFGSGAERPNEYTTDGYMFASFSQREADMVDYAMAIIIFPGGVGTEWEIFETMAKIQTDKKDQVPVILLGKQEIWDSLFNRLQHMADLGTISPEDINLLQVAQTPDEAIEIIKTSLLTMN